MLTVITGLPGSGKTAGVVERFLMPLAAKDWEEHAITPEGEKVVVKRRLFTNINGLLLEHEKIDGDDLARWQEWVKPGDLIVFDEVQKPWPLTGANKEQPKCITELETHRHYGIDMILMTQHPMLINSAIVRLAGQHLHIRKLGNSRFATIYEWDGVSRTLLYKNAFAKKQWRRSKKAEQIYRSSSLHTKQKRSLPTVLYVIVACLVAFPLVAWKFGDSFKERYFSGKPLIASAVSPALAPKAGPGATQEPSAGTAEGLVAWKGKDAPKLVGCAAVAHRCSCFDSDGAIVEKGPGYYEVQTGKLDAPPISLAKLVIPEQELRERALATEDPDAALLAFAGGRERKAAPVPVATGSVAVARR